MQLGISLTTTLGKDKILLGAGEKPNGELYRDLVQQTAAIAKKFSLPCIELASFPPFDAVVIGHYTTEIADILEPFDISFHLPAWEVNPVALNDQIRAAAIAEQKATIDFAAAIGATQLCLHPASFEAMPWAYGWFLDQVLTNAKNAIDELQRHAASQSTELNIENLPHKSLYFTKPEHFADYVSHEVGLVLDTAHAITAGVDPVTFIQAYPRHIKEVHLVDGFRGQPDSHTPVGGGDTDFASVFAALKEVEFTGSIIVEMMSEEDAQESLDYLRKIEAL